MALKAYYCNVRLCLETDYCRFLFHLKWKLRERDKIFLNLNICKIFGIRLLTDFIKFYVLLSIYLVFFAS